MKILKINIIQINFIKNNNYIKLIIYKIFNKYKKTFFSVKFFIKNLMYLPNIILFYLIKNAVSDYEQLQIYPLYLKCITHKLNVLPDFLQKKKEIILVIQQQFEDLEITISYINVTVFFNGRPYRLFIHLSTIFFLEVFKKIRIELPRNKGGDYLDELDIVYNSYEDYTKNFIQNYCDTFSQNILNKTDLISKVIEEKKVNTKNKQKIVDIETIINIKNKK